MNKNTEFAILGNSVGQLSRFLGQATEHIPVNLRVSLTVLNPEFTGHHIFNQRLKETS